MSLAMFAAPFEEEDNEDTIKKHKKTLKKYPKIESFDANKVNSILQKIHANVAPDDDEEDNYRAPQQSQSVAAAAAKPVKEGFNKNIAPSFTQNTDEVGMYDKSDNQTAYNQGESADEYYKRVLPNHNHKKRYSDDNSNSGGDIMQKVNYMISLLEDQQDERTEFVTEEVILYSFLGIFIIFIADTFVKAGRYTR